MELSEETHGISARKIFFLGVIDGHLDVKIWLGVGSDWVWNSLEELVVWCALQTLLQISELSGLVQFVGSVWVQVTEVVEVFLTETLASGIAHLWAIEGVVDDLNGLPITLSLEEFVHDGLGGLIAVGHDPSVEVDEPDLFEEHLDLAGRVLVDHLGDVFDVHSAISVVGTLSSLVLSNVLNDGVDELTEVLTNWQVDKDLLEENDEVLAGEAAD